jgi:hypothetical protein
MTIAIFVSISKKRNDENGLFAIIKAPFADLASPLEDPCDFISPPG